MKKKRKSTKRARGHSRRQRWWTRDRAIASGAIGLGVLVTVGIVAGLLLAHPVAEALPTPSPSSTPPLCPKVPDVHVDQFVVPAGPVAGFCQPQLINAVRIIEAGQSIGVTTRAQEVGVMTAIGESGLRNLTYGDLAGPDSRGLFQQRKNWGSVSDRMNPYVASRHFFQRMVGVPDWNKLPPTKIAHIVQGNANPNYYTPYFPRAIEVVTTLRASRLKTPIPAPSD